MAFKFVSRHDALSALSYLSYTLLVDFVSLAFDRSSRHLVSILCVFFVVFHDASWSWLFLCLLCGQCTPLSRHIHFTREQIEKLHWETSIASHGVARGTTGSDTHRKMFFSWFPHFLLSLWSETYNFNRYHTRLGLMCCVVLCSRLPLNFLLSLMLFYERRDDIYRHFTRLHYF